MSEVMPPISFDKNIGNYFSNIDVNYDALIEYMQAQGFDISTIEKTRIHFSSKDTSFLGPDGKEKTVYGVYDRVTGTITMYPRAACDINFDHPSITSIDELEDIRQKISAMYSKEFSRSITHELTHKKERPANRVEEGEMRCIVDELILELAANIDEYQNDPEEIRCRAEAEIGPEDLVSFEIKVQSIPSSLSTVVIHHSS